MMTFGPCKIVHAALEHESVALDQWTSGFHKIDLQLLKDRPSGSQAIDQRTSGSLPHDELSGS